MSIYAIAAISDGYKTIGYRLLDTITKQIKDVPINSIKSALRNKKVQIKNMTIDDAGELVGTNGSLERLTTFVGGIIQGQANLVIINKIKNKGFTIADCYGNIVKMSVKDIRYKFCGYGLANGKFVYRDGQFFISALEGEFEIVDDKLTEEEQSTLVNKLNIMFTVVESKFGYHIIENNGLKGIINSKGKKICDYLYRDIEILNNNRAIVDRGYGNKGLLSLTTGEELIKSDKMSIDKFGEGYYDLFHVISIDKQEIVDINGKRVIGPFETINNSYNCNFYIGFNMENGRDVYYVISRGAKILGRYAAIIQRSYSPSRHAIVKFFNGDGGNKYGILNDEGGLITRNKYYEIKILNDRGSAILTRLYPDGSVKHKICVLYDMDYHEGHAEEYDYIGEFKGEYAIVKKDDLYGVITSRGHIHIRCSYPKVEITDTEIRYYKWSGGYGVVPII